MAGMLYSCHPESLYVEDSIRYRPSLSTTIGDFSCHGPPFHSASIGPRSCHARSAGIVQPWLACSIYSGEEGSEKHHEYH